MMSVVSIATIANDDKRGVFRNFTYQPLRAYSTTYQGNNGLDSSGN